MERLLKSFAMLTLLPCCVIAADRNDPRLRTELYSPQQVTTLYAKRGVTTHIQLGDDEQIEYVSTGVGADCKSTTDTWCVIAPSHGNQLFVKPKSSASGSNNIAVATNRRAYSLRFLMVADDDAREPVYRLTYRFQVSKPEQVESSGSIPSSQVSASLDQTLLPTPSSAETVKERLKATPQVVNADYSMKAGKHSEDIAPSLVFDDGRFTYFKYPNNREVPAIFQVSDNGQEQVVNAHMEIDPVTGRKDLLCVDVVAKRFYLRRGQAVVGIWNESFDIDGVPPLGGTTVAGVERVLRRED